MSLSSPVPSSHKLPLQALAEASACSSRSFDVKQFWSTSGMPGNGDLAREINAFNVPFHQKWNAYYLAVRESPEEDRLNRFQVAVQVLSCTDGSDGSDGSVSSQVFSRGNQDQPGFSAGFTGFCGGALSWGQVDGIWYHRAHVILLISPTPKLSLAPSFLYWSVPANHA